MKKILTVIGGAFIVFSVMSYSTTDGRNSNGGFSATIIIPLKQKGIVVTDNIKQVYKLIKKGWVVEDVDIIGESYHRDIERYYTLIKY